MHHTTNEGRIDCMNSVVKALVVDDHPLFAQATKQILEQIEQVEVVGVVGNGQKCMELVEMHRPKLVFLDYHLPDQPGSKVAAQIKARFPETHVVVFTGIDVTDMFNNLVELGVSGVISKESSEVAIKNMVSCVLDNHTMLPLSLFHQTRLVTGKSAEEAQLTGDEIEMMSMIVNGYTHEQIADQIHVSKRSVDNYLKKIYEKFGVKTKVQAIEKFVQSKYYSDSIKGE